MKKIFITACLFVFPFLHLHAKTINWKTNRWVNSLGINMSRNMEYIAAMDRDYNLNFVMGFSRLPHAIGRSYGIDVVYDNYSNVRMDPAYVDGYIIWNFLKPDKFRIGALILTDGVTYCSLEAQNPLSPGETIGVSYASLHALLSARIAYSDFFILTAGLLLSSYPYYEKDSSGNIRLSWKYDAGIGWYYGSSRDSFYYADVSLYGWSSEIRLNTSDYSLGHFKFGKSLDFGAAGEFSAAFTYDLFMETLRAGFGLSGMNPAANFFINAETWFDIHKNNWCLWLGSIAVSEKYYFLTGAKPHSGLYAEASQSITADVLKETMPGFSAKISAENILLSFYYATFSAGFSYNYSQTLYTAPVKDDFIWFLSLDMTFA